MEKTDINSFKAKNVEIRWIKKLKMELILFLILMLSSTFLLRSFEMNNLQHESSPKLSYSPLYSYAYESDFSWVSPDVEFCYDITIDKDDNIYFAGITDYLTRIGKFDLMGNQLWNLTVDLGTIREIALDTSGNIFGIAGSNLFKITSNGDLNWFKSLNVTLHSMVLSPDDNIYLTTDGRDYFLMKYNSSGELMWNATWSGMYVNEMQIDPEENIYLGGSTSSLGAGGSDACVAKFNSTGSYMWHQTFGGPDNEFGNALVMDSSGNVYLGGSLDYGIFHYSSDMFVAKYDENGTILWHHYFGTPYYYEVCNSILLRNETYLNQNDCLFLCGSSYYGGDDRYFCIYSICTSSGSLQASFEEWLGPDEYMAYSSAFDSNENIWIGRFLRDKNYGNYDMCVARFGKDSDRDGLSDDQEINLYHTNPDRNDSDNDGLNDYEEVMIYNTNPNNPDTDGDGLNDKDEILKGFDPNNRFSNEYFGILLVILSIVGVFIVIPLIIAITRNYITERKISS